MAKITRNITINAPVEKVFEYHTDPANNTEYWPSMMEVRDIEDHPSGGKKFNWVYKMAGVRFEGTTTPVEWVRNKRSVVESKGGIESTFVYNYEPEGEGTKISMELDYKVPVPVLGKLAESIILKTNEREADVIFGNLKDILEG
jgi:ligand-binding SRPBCC domain-containing protein